jgi:hypothetical protein
MIERSAASRGIHPVRAPGRPCGDIWSSGEELDEFLAEVRRWRRADLA